jgi:hypothetical protein
MKVIGFSHVTFCLPEELMEFGKHLFGEGVETRIPNHPNKMSFMRGRTPDHYLYWNKSGIEVTSYPSLLKANRSTLGFTINQLQNYKLNPRQINLKLSICQRYLLKALGAKIQLRKSGFRVVGKATLPSFDFVQNKLEKSISMSKFLDEAGIVALAFYVDRPFKIIFPFGFLGILRLSKVFQVTVVNSNLNIQLLRFGGITYEFISQG